MGFRDYEGINSHHQFILNGKKGFKYADIIICNGEEYYHIIFVKIANEFTLLMDDYKTYPSFELVKTSLRLLKNIEFDGMPAKDCPNIDRLNELYKALTPEYSQKRIKNYVININQNNIISKHATFFLNGKHPIDSANIIITNMELYIEAYIEKEVIINITGYDKQFYINVNDEKVFPNLVCTSTNLVNNNILLNMVSEHQYSLKQSMGKHLFSGTQTWMLEVMEYLINVGREDSIGVLMESQELPKYSRRFFFSFAINGMKIKNDIRFGLVNFSTESGIGTERQDEYLKLLNENPDCYAQLVIQSNSVSNAINEAIAYLNKAINVLMLVLLDDSPLQFFGICDGYKCWQCDVLSSEIIVQEQFYLEDVLNCNNAILSSVNKQTNTCSEINSPLEKILNNDNILENYFYSEMTVEKENLLQAVFWLNSSYKKKDKKERIIALYNCVEFLVTGQKGKTLYDELNNTYNEKFEEAFAKITDSISSINNKDLKNRISGAVNGVLKGNSSVQSKLQCLLENLDINLTTEEWELFKILKNNRHSLIHNKECKRIITNQELDELYHIFSKIIIHTIINMSGGEFND